MNYTHNDESIYAPSPDIFGDGEGACENGDSRSACPYPADSTYAHEWLRGWDAMQKIRDEWETLHD